jgi:hypothetical protein
MRFMVMVKASKESEAGVLPSTDMLTAMGKYNEELVKAGIMQAGEGLQASSKGASRPSSASRRNASVPRARPARVYGRPEAAPKKVAAATRKVM